MTVCREPLLPFWLLFFSGFFVGVVLTTILAFKLQHALSRTPDIVTHSELQEREDKKKESDIGGKSDEVSGSEENGKRESDKDQGTTKVRTYEEVTLDYLNHCRNVKNSRALCKLLRSFLQEVENVQKNYAKAIFKLTGSLSANVREKETEPLLQQCWDVIVSGLERVGRAHQDVGESCAGSGLSLLQRMETELAAVESQQTLRGALTVKEYEAAKGACANAEKDFARQDAKAKAFFAEAQRTAQEGDETRKVANKQLFVRLQQAQETLDRAMSQLSSAEASFFSQMPDVLEEFAAGERKRTAGTIQMVNLLVEQFEAGEQHCRVTLRAMMSDLEALSGRMAYSSSADSTRSKPDSGTGKSVENDGRESCRWFEVFLQRFWRDCARSEVFNESCRQKIAAALNKGTLPGYLDPIRVVDFRFGHKTPSVSYARLLPPSSRLEDLAYDDSGKGKKVTERGNETITSPTEDDHDVESTIELHECPVSFTVATNVWLNWPKDRFTSMPISVKITLVHMSARLRVGVRYQHTFVSFMSEPYCRFAVDSELGSTKMFQNLPQVSSFLVSKLTAALRANYLYPRCMRFPLPWHSLTKDGETSEASRRRSSGRPAEDDSTFMPTELGSSRLSMASTGSSEEASPMDVNIRKAEPETQPAASSARAELGIADFSNSSFLSEGLKEGQKLHEQNSAQASPHMGSLYPDYHESAKAAEKTSEDKEGQGQPERWTLGMAAAKRHIAGLAREKLAQFDSKIETFTRERKGTSDRSSEDSNSGLVSQLDSVRSLLGNSGHRSADSKEVQSENYGSLSPSTFQSGPFLSVVTEDQLEEYLKVRVNEELLTRRKWARIQSGQLTLADDNSERGAEKGVQETVAVPLLGCTCKEATAWYEKQFSFTLLFRSRSGDPLAPRLANTVIKKLTLTTSSAERRALWLETIGKLSIAPLCNAPTDPTSAIPASAPSETCTSLGQDPEEEGTAKTSPSISSKFEEAMAATVPEAELPSSSDSLASTSITLPLGVGLTPTSVSSYPLSPPDFSPLPSTSEAPSPRASVDILSSSGQELALTPVNLFSMFLDKTLASTGALTATDSQPRDSEGDTISSSAPTRRSLTSLTQSLSSFMSSSPIAPRPPAEALKDRLEDDQIKAPESDDRDSSKDCAAVVTPATVLLGNSAAFGKDGGVEKCKTSPPGQDGKTCDGAAADSHKEIVTSVEPY